ncbi:extra-large guanine nucleotide-binding protein 1 [Phtheirospermum japonicum]|uniref:Extra-large guanine nucleotide-binding protein 1 n=1 Tax=Phtheirospermum japonicum TaxID=374723 RepID=A0A830CLE4_9LAMI|nr:extra-large guanine nucleotide-binding protein 1 [Phtheirospermum japonicum]
MENGAAVVSWRRRGMDSTVGGTCLQIETLGAKRVSMADGDGALGGEYMGQSPPPSPRASQSPLMFRPQMPVVPLQRPDEQQIPNPSWMQTSSTYEDTYNEQGVTTMITWSYGGDEVLVEGSWDDWKTRKPLQRSGKDFTIMMVLSSGVYEFYCRWPIEFMGWTIWARCLHRQCAGVQCAGNPHFWVNEDGSYQEEEQKNTKGYIWGKLLCAVLSLPVPSKSSQPCGEQATSMNIRSLPDYLEQRAIQKLLLIGYIGSGTSTIFKQDERERIKLVIQSHVYSYIGTLLEGRERFEKKV